MWFAIAAVIPVAYYFLRFSNGPLLFADSPALSAGTPILIASLCGLLLGSSILNADDVRTAGQAIMRGLIVALLSYLLLFTVSALILAFNNDDLAGLVVTWAIIFLMGLLIVGWLIAIIGAIAGWLLYLYRLKVIDGQGKV
jgi:hypothetical protein